MSDRSGRDIHCQCKTHGEGLFAEAVCPDIHCPVQADTIWHSGCSVLSSEGLSGEKGPGVSGKPHWAYLYKICKCHKEGIDCLPP